MTIDHPDPCPLCASPSRITASVTYRDATGHRLQCRKCANRFASVTGHNDVSKKIVAAKLAGPRKALVAKSTPQSARTLFDR